MANTISSILFVLFGGCLLWCGVRGSAMLAQRHDFAAEEAEDIDDSEDIYCATVGAEELQETGGASCLMMLVFIVGAGVLIYGIGGVFHLWDTWQPIVSSLNDPYW